MEFRPEHYPLLQASYNGSCLGYRFSLEAILFELPKPDMVFLGTEDYAREAADFKKDSELLVQEKSELFPDSRSLKKHLKIDPQKMSEFTGLDPYNIASFPGTVGLSIEQPGGGADTNDAHLSFTQYDNRLVVESDSLVKQPAMTSLLSVGFGVLKNIYDAYGVDSSLLPRVETERSGLRADIPIPTGMVYDGPVSGRGSVDMMISYDDAHSDRNNEFVENFINITNGIRRYLLKKDIS